MQIPSWVTADLAGWALTLLYLIYEIRGPRGKIKELTGLLKNTIIVVRGLARVHEEVDTEKVDEYLVENGMEPSDFINRDGDPAEEITRDQS